MYQFKLFFDGGCRPNPGRGYGSYDIQSVTPLNNQSMFFHRERRIEFGWMTNNMAEYHAMITAIKKLLYEAREGYLKEHVTTRNMRLQMFTDSQLLVKQMTGYYGNKKPHLQALEFEARTLLKEFGRWNVKWKPREHSVKRFGH